MRSKWSNKSLTSDHKAIRELLDSRVQRYNQPNFIPQDPIAIPHAYSCLQDIEIAGFWTAMLSWGQRKTILTKARELFSLMDNAPYDFILHHKEKDRKRFLSFKHRTFQPLDTLYFLEFLQQYYRTNDSLEDAFFQSGQSAVTEMRSALAVFHTRFFDHPYTPDRTRKHVSTPIRNSACKRLNMFLRWMVRTDSNGVDFGLWRRMSPAVLMIPLDVHVERVALKLKLLSGSTTGWKAVEELTEVLRSFDPDDPVKYDFALFGMGVLE
jgi:uncharacterized protein (TIGR02757 family)